MREIKAALFDLDGTLVDSEGQYTRLWTQNGLRWAPQYPHLAQDIKGTTLVQILNTYFPDPEVQKQVIRACEEFESQMDFTPYPGAVDFVKSLRQHGVRTAIVTSSDRSKMEKFRRNQPSFGTLFDCILTSEDFVASKPDPDPYLKAAAALGCDIRDCVVLEDAFSGLESGMRSGALTIGLATTNSPEAIEGLCHCVWEGFEGKTFESLQHLAAENL